MPCAVMCRGLPHAYTYTYGICAACVCVGNTVAHKYLKHANISTDTLRIQTHKTVQIKHIKSSKTPVTDKFLFGRGYPPFPGGAVGWVEGGGGGGPL